MYILCKIKHQVLTKYNVCISYMYMYLVTVKLKVLWYFIPQDHHCSENALKSSAMRRKQSQQSGTSIAPQTVPALVYPTDAAWQAIRRFSPKPPYPEFTVSIIQFLSTPLSKLCSTCTELCLHSKHDYSHEQFLCTELYLHSRHVYSHEQFLLICL